MYSSYFLMVTVTNVETFKYSSKGLIAVNYRCSLKLRSRSLLLSSNAMMQFHEFFPS